MPSRDCIILIILQGDKVMSTKAPYITIRAERE